MSGELFRGPVPLVGGGAQPIQIPVQGVVPISPTLQPGPFQVHVVGYPVHTPTLLAQLALQLLALDADVGQPGGPDDEDEDAEAEEAFFRRYTDRALGLLLAAEGTAAEFEAAARAARPA
jgi:hypothetical protein